MWSVVTFFLGVFFTLSLAEMYYICELKDFINRNTVDGEEEQPENTTFEITEEDLEN